MNEQEYIKKMAIVPNAQGRLILEQDFKTFLYSFDGQGKELTEKDIQKINMIKSIIYNPNYPLKFDN
jgi:hypothetical protein